MTESAEKGVALVTGASMGIGAVYAEKLAARGYDLLLVARDEPKLAALASRIVAATGRKVEVLKADLTDRSDRLAVEARLRSDTSITLLVNNAGLLVASPMADADPDAIETMIDLNVVALTRLTLAALPGFVARGAGGIIQIASVVPLIPERFPNLYSSTKAFVLHFGEALNVQLAGTGVRVQTLLPGATATAIWEKAGVPVESLPPEMVMQPEAMVDAAIAGFEAGETVTIPSLPDIGDWDAYNAARLALAPNLSRSQPAGRYLGETQQAA
ncbi:SDR family oxidoreductase [Kaistia algarum]|uniref:SDR family NAD(P)-dependent oxidoreductase n=1 Tax=Kaistia algarum TaxID=2083279 RepID=UPI000CE76956|nr:SDR family oxidoreductase [Kaistia algarum]MCX5516124.1 SDR family oxidoreductase [Kaistia algarum]PPE78200.1 SDR family oxidoreductase [Kaistia algarum]